jgi:hypothetical protein
MELLKQFVKPFRKTDLQDLVYMNVRMKYILFFTDQAFINDVMSTFSRYASKYFTSSNTR